MTEPKKLTRDTSAAVVGGVAAGLAEFFGVDTTLVRVVFALLIVFTGVFPGAVAYLVLWLIIPPKPSAAPPAPPPSASP